MTTRRETANVKHEAICCADELIILIDEMIPKRRATINIIKDIAAKLTGVNKDVNIAKVVGFAASIIGGIAGAAGVIMTGGLLAAPLMIGGGAIALGGTATSVGADIVGHILSSDQLKEAQNALDDDRKISLKIDEKKKQLDTLIDELGEHLERKSEEVFAEVMLESLLNKNDSTNVTLIRRSIVISTKLLQKFAPKLYSVGNAAKIASAIEKVSVKGLARMFGSVFAKVTGVAFIILDVALLVNTSVQLHNGSKTEAADDLLLFAGKLAEGTNNLERMINEFRDVAENFQAEIKQDLRKQLLAISIKDVATEDECKVLLEDIATYAKKGWMERMKKSKINVNTYLSSIGKIYRHFDKIVSSFKEKEQEDKEHPMRIPITMVGHGRIDQNSRYPCSLYYMTDSLKSITLYQPWGCLINASVVYAIAINTLDISNVEYSGTIYKSNTGEVGLPLEWNVLPALGNNSIPTPIFSTIKQDENAFKTLLDIIRNMPGKPDGIVIPYMNMDDSLDLPDAPLYMVVHALSLIGSLSNLEIDFRYAACLGNEDIDVSASDKGLDIVSDSIYYSAKLNAIPRVFMSISSINTPNDENMQVWLHDVNTRLLQLTAPPP